METKEVIVPRVAFEFFPESKKRSLSDCREAVRGPTCWHVSCSDPEIPDRARWIRVTAHLSTPEVTWVHLPSAELHSISRKEGVVVGYSVPCDKTSIWHSVTIFNSGWFMHLREGYKFLDAGESTGRISESRRKITDVSIRFDGSPPEGQRLVQFRDDNSPGALRFGKCTRTMKLPLDINSFTIKASADKLSTFELFQLPSPQCMDMLENEKMRAFIVSRQRVMWTCVVVSKGAIHSLSANPTMSLCLGR